MKLNFKNRYITKNRPVDCVVYFHFYDFETLRYLYTKHLARQFTPRLNNYEYYRICFNDIYQYEEEHWICLLTNEIDSNGGLLVYRRIKIYYDRFYSIFIDKYHKDYLIIKYDTCEDIRIYEKFNSISKAYKLLDEL